MLRACRITPRSENMLLNLSNCHQLSCQPQRAGRAILSRGSLGRWAVRVCGSGSTSWWDRGAGIDPTQPLTLPLTLPLTEPFPLPGHKRARNERLRRFSIYFLIPIGGSPNGPRPMRRSKSYPSKIRAARLLGLYSPQQPRSATCGRCGISSCLLSVFASEFPKELKIASPGLVSVLFFVPFRL